MKRPARLGLARVSVVCIVITLYLLSILSFISKRFSSRLSLLICF